MLKPNGHGVECLCDMCWNALLDLIEAGPLVEKCVQINPDGSRIIKAIATDATAMKDGVG